MRREDLWDLHPQLTPFAKATVALLMSIFGRLASQSQTALPVATQLSMLK